MTINKYYIRIASEDKERFEQYLLSSGLSYRADQMPTGPASTYLYVVNMDEEAELSLKLTFQLIGYINFSKTPENLVTYGKL